MAALGKRLVLAAVVLLIAGAFAARALATPDDVPQVHPIWKVEVRGYPSIAVSGNGRYVALLARKTDRQSPRVLRVLGRDGRRLFEHEFPPDEGAGPLAVTAKGDIVCSYYKRPRPDLPHATVWMTGGVYRFSSTGAITWKTKWTRYGLAGPPLGSVAGIAETPDGLRILLEKYSDLETIGSLAVLDGEGKILSEFKASDGIGRVDLSPDGSYLLCSGSDGLVARSLDFSELWHVDGLEPWPHTLRPISQDGSRILANGIEPFVASKWDPESGRLAGSAGRGREWLSFGWAVLDSAGQPVWGYGTYQVLPDGYTPTPIDDVFDHQAIVQGSIGGTGDRARVLSVVGRRRMLLALGRPSGRDIRTLYHIALPPLSSGADRTVLSADGTRVACLALKVAGEEWQADLSIYDGEGRAVWASAPGVLREEGRGSSRLLMSDDGKFVVVLLGQTLYAFVEPRAGRQ